MGCILFFLSFISIKTKLESFSQVKKVQKGIVIGGDSIPIRCIRTRLNKGLEYFLESKQTDRHAIRPFIYLF